MKPNPSRGAKPQFFRAYVDTVAMALCLFCARQEATVEHIIPKEMSRRLWEVSPFTPEHGAPLPKPTAAQRFHHSRFVDLKVAAVCGRCNGDFFNKLQDGARPFWQSAIAGEAVELDTALQRSVAGWAYKTALLLRLPGLHRKDWEPAIGGLARDMRLTGRPQAGARVWSARYDLRDDFPEHTVMARVAELHVRRRGTEFVGVQVLFTVGYMMYVVIYWPHEMPDSIPSEDQRYPESQFAVLWPIYSGQAHWPPDHLFRYREIEELVSADEARELR
jgi:hypothetical protein